MNSTPDYYKDNWYRFGDPDSNNDEEEIVLDPDVDEVESDNYDAEDE
jgi:hypothetical protein